MLVCDWLLLWIAVALPHQVVEDSAVQSVYDT
jgi:hypothetical protein